MRILIFTSSLGAGHKSIAQALSEIIEVNDSSSTIKVQDISSKLASKVYPLIGNHLTSTLASAWEWSDNPDTASFLVKLFDLAEGEKIAKLISKYTPDLIITTENLSAYSVQEYMRTSGVVIPHIVVIADPLTIHHYWTAETNADLYIAPLQETANVLISRGIPKNKISVTGYPLRKMFFAEPSATTEDNTIFLGGSGEGQGDIQKVIKEIIKREGKIDRLNMIIACGKNNELARKLKSLDHPDNFKLEIHKFVHNIEPLISRSQFVVGKPGPNILFESITLGKPFVAIGDPLTQELGNYELIDAESIGSSANNPRFAAEKIINLLKSPSQLAKYKQNLKKFRSIQRESHTKIWHAISKTTKNQLPTEGELV